MPSDQGFDIQRFQSKIAKSGVMRNNKFLVRIPYPVGFGPHAKLNGVARDLEYWCESINIPGVSLATNEIRRYGYGNVEKKPYGATMNDVSLSFIGDGKADVWTFFQQWIRMIVNYDMRNGINPPNTNGILRYQKPFELAYKSEYVSDIEIVVFNENNTEILNIVLREAYPIFVGDISMNWGDTNNIARIPVTLSVFDWYNKAKFDLVDRSEDTYITDPRNRYVRQRTNYNDIGNTVTLGTDPTYNDPNIASPF